MEITGLKLWPRARGPGSGDGTPKNRFPWAIKTERKSRNINASGFAVTDKSGLLLTAHALIVAHGII